jgi:hypothetical protein
MKQEEKQLLLKDLCSRLPYEVILLSSNRKVTYQTDGNTAAELLVEEGWKPYLRPMSSMTEEERIESLDFAWKDDYGRLASYDENIPKYIDWLNAHHFDFRGLIEKGLALESPEGMY